MKKYFRNNMNMFDKIEWLKKLSQDAIGISDEATLRRMLKRLSVKGSTKYIKKYGISQFTQQELILDQLMKSNEVSPRTAYNWFLYIRASKEVCDLGRKGAISQNDIKRHLYSGLQKPDQEHEKLGKEIIRDILKIVEGM